MIAFKLCWPIFALWYMCWETTSHLVSTQMSNADFELKYGVRYECGVRERHSCHSMLECAANCAKDRTCYGFNFRHRQCELLSAAASFGTNAPGWIHGYRPTGKCQIIRNPSNSRYKVPNNMLVSMLLTFVHNCRRNHSMFFCYYHTNYIVL